MTFTRKFTSASALMLCASLAFADVIDTKEMEDGNRTTNNTGDVNQPFDGVALYAAGGGVSFTARIVDAPGRYQLNVRGSSSNNGDASISVYLGGKFIGSTQFSGQTPSTQRIPFELYDFPESYTLDFLLEKNGGPSTQLDWYEIERTGDIPPPKPAPSLPATGAYESGQYRNMFAELGYSEAEVEQKVQAAYDQLFHSTDQDNEAIFIPVGDDMAYIWDVGNDDVRSEGMSYGMMMAVQMDRQEDFDKLWKWAHTYSLNKTGNMKGYFAWQVGTDMKVMDDGPAPDGEEYFVTALFFAAHRWGDTSGIFNYTAMANQILDDMYGNGETRWDDGKQVEYSLFDHDEKQVLFSPKIQPADNFTDPSYHLPAFYELWARWADNNNDFWADAAVISRDFFKNSAHPETGLVPDYAYFDGRGHGAFQPHKATFQFDAWRTIGNAAMDTYWWNKDNWQTTYANRLQKFFKEQGMKTYASLYYLDGKPYEGDKFQAGGIVAMNAMASLAADHSNSWDFVQALWDAQIPQGQWRYYDGSLYMFGMLALSGNYNIYCPENSCSIDPLTNRAPVAYNDFASVKINNKISVDVVANDNDNDKAGLFIKSISTPANGEASIEGHLINYAPDTNFTGEEVITYVLDDGEFTATGTLTITVTAADAVATEVTGVQLNINEITLTVGDTDTLVATVLPATATEKTVSWKSSAPSIASVDSSTGKVTALKTGSATMTVTTQQGNYTATAKVNVIAQTDPDDNIPDETENKDIAVTSISLSSNGLDLKPQQTAALTATVLPSNATNKSVSWKSSNTNVASVSNTGRVTALVAGTATITASTTDGNYTATAKVNVIAQTDPDDNIPDETENKDIAVTSISLSSNGLDLKPQQTAALTATVLPSNATNKSVSWKSSNTNVASVSNTGRVTALAAGTATITATTTDGNYTATSTVTVTTSNDTTTQPNTGEGTIDNGNGNGSTNNSGATTTPISVGAIPPVILWLSLILVFRKDRHDTRLYKSKKEKTCF